MIKYEQWPPRERGGQHVGTGSPGIRATHWFEDGIASGIEVCVSVHRSQFKNKQVAQEMIEWALASAGIEV